MNVLNYDKIATHDEDELRLRLTYISQGINP